MTAARTVSLAAVLAAMLAATQCRNAQARVRESLLKADSLAAVADSTRTLRLKLEQLGDSLRVVERRVVQHAPSADSVDLALALEPSARVDMRASITALDTRTRSDTVWLRAEDSVRTAKFEIRQAPFTAQATVELPPPPLEGTLALKVSIDSARIDLRVGCGADVGAGVRPATVAVIAPTWLTIQVAKAEQSPDVCSPPQGGDPSSTVGLFDRMRRRVGVSVGFGIVAPGSGMPTSGIGVMAGFRVWP